MAGVLTWLFMAIVLASSGAGGEWWITHHGHVEWRSTTPFTRWAHLSLPDSLKADRDHWRELATAHPVAREAKATAIAAAVAETITKTQIVYRDRFTTLQGDVKTYVPPEADRACSVGTGFVRLFNAAAAGEAVVPGAAGGPLEAPSGVALSTVADTVVVNDAAFYQAITELKGWRAWYGQQAAEWAKPSP